MSFLISPLLQFEGTLWRISGDKYNDLNARETSSCRIPQASNQIMGERSHVCFLLFRLGQCVQWSLGPLWSKNVEVFASSLPSGLSPFWSSATLSGEHRFCCCGILYLFMRGNSAFWKTLLLRVWRDGSAVKSTGCSYRGPQFRSQHSWWVPNCLELQLQGVRCSLLASEHTHTHAYKFPAPHICNQK